MRDHIVLVLDAPLMAFGGEIIDAYGVVRYFPGRSTVTGLIANALGYDRTETDRHGRLQARLVMGSARLAEGRRIRDFQTALLFQDDAGWTTRGRTEGRSTSPTYVDDEAYARSMGVRRKSTTHIRYRDLDADALVLVALRLEPAGEAPTLADVEAALMQPERPLFIGRKPCLPSRPLVAGRVEADDVRGALERAVAACLEWKPTRFRPHRSRLGRREARNPHGFPGPRRSEAGDPAGEAASERRGFRAQWPEGEGGGEATRLFGLCDERNWASGVHGGLRQVVEGGIPLPSASNGAGPEATP